MTLMPTKYDFCRHESTCSIPLETEYLCRQCNCVYGDIDELEEHLRVQHDMQWVRLWRPLADSALEAGWQGRFWCGFCRSAVENDQQRGALDARNSHVLRHLREHYQAMDWVQPLKRATQAVQHATELNTEVSTPPTYQTV